MNVPPSAAPQSLSPVFLPPSYPSLLLSHDHLSFFGCNSCFVAVYHVVIITVSVFVLETRALLDVEVTWLLCWLPRPDPGAGRDARGLEWDLVCLDLDSEWWNMHRNQATGGYNSVSETFWIEIHGKKYINIATQKTHTLLKQFTEACVLGTFTLIAWDTIWYLGSD